MNDTRFEMIEVPRSKVSGIITYQVLEVENGTLILETKSINSYMAVLIKEYPGRWRVLNRFGREDRIGKGDSKFRISLPGVYLARLKPNSDESTTT